MNRNRVMGLLAMAGLLAPVLGASCIPSGREATGTLRVLITDKAYPFEFISQAIVTVTRVQIREAEGEDSDDDSGFITVFEDSDGQEFDLIQLQNGVMDVLADAEVPVGTYTQLRLVIAGGEVTLTNDAVFNLTVPSGSTSGIKLNATFEVAEGQVTELLLDFDLSRAFDVIPGSAVDSIDDITEFRFSPSLQGAIRIVQTSESGQIAGTVTASVEGTPIVSASVTAYDSDDNEVSTTATDENGVYLLTGLPAGTYTVEISASGFQTVQVADVAVTAGETTENVDAAMAE